MKAFSKPLNTLAVIVGGTLIALFCADFIVQMREQTFGMGISPDAAAESSAPLFLLGLVVGVVSGIAMFFVYIVMREKKQHAEQDELALLLDEVSRDDTVFNEEEWLSSNEMPEVREDNTQALDPWERGADWWKSEE